MVVGFDLLAYILLLLTRYITINSKSNHIWIELITNERIIISNMKNTQYKIINAEIWMN